MYITNNLYNDYEFGNIQEFADSTLQQITIERSLESAIQNYQNY